MLRGFRILLGPEVGEPLDSVGEGVSPGLGRQAQG